MFASICDLRNVFCEPVKISFIQESETRLQDSKGYLYWKNGNWMFINDHLKLKIQLETQIREYTIDELSFKTTTISNASIKINFESETARIIFRRIFEAHIIDNPLEDEDILEYTDDWEFKPCKWVVSVNHKQAINQDGFASISRGKFFDRIIVTDTEDKVICSFRTKPTLSQQLFKIPYTDKKLMLRFEDFLDHQPLPVPQQPEANLPLIERFVWSDDDLVYGMERNSIWNIQTKKIVAVVTDSRNLACIFHNELFEYDETTRNLLHKQTKTRINNFCGLCFHDSFIYFVTQDSIFRLRIITKEITLLRKYLSTSFKGIASSTNHLVTISTDTVRIHNPNDSWKKALRAIKVSNVLDFSVRGSQLLLLTYNKIILIRTDKISLNYFDDTICLKTIEVPPEIRILTVLATDQKFFFGSNNNKLFKHDNDKLEVYREIESITELCYKNFEVYVLQNGKVKKIE